MFWALYVAGADVHFSTISNTRYEECLGFKISHKNLHTQDVWTSYQRYRKRIKTRIYPPMALQQSNVAMDTSTPFVDFISAHGGFSLLRFDCSSRTVSNSSIELPKRLSEQPMRSWLHSHNGSTRVNFHILHVTMY